MFTSRSEFLEDAEQPSVAGGGSGALNWGSDRFRFADLEASLRAGQDKSLRGLRRAVTLGQSLE